MRSWRHPRGSTEPGVDVSRNRASTRSSFDGKAGISGATTHADSRRRRGWLRKWPKRREAPAVLWSCRLPSDERQAGNRRMRLLCGKARASAVPRRRASRRRRGREIGERQGSSRTWRETPFRVWGVVTRNLEVSDQIVVVTDNSSLWQARAWQTLPHTGGILRAAPGQSRPTRSHEQPRQQPRRGRSVIRQLFCGKWSRARARSARRLGRPRGQRSPRLLGQAAAFRGSRVSCRRRAARTPRVGPSGCRRSSRRS